jgi:hypothetical protein
MRIRTNSAILSGLVLWAACGLRLKDGKDTDLAVARDRAREFKARAGC